MSELRHILRKRQSHCFLCKGVEGAVVNRIFNSHHWGEGGVLDIM